MIKKLLIVVWIGALFSLLMGVLFRAKGVELKTSKISLIVALLSTLFLIALIKKEK